MSLKRAIASSFLALACGSSAVSCQQARSTTSICELVRSGQAGSGLSAKLSLRFETDMSGHSFLWDPQCPAVRAVLLFPAKKPWDSSVEQFEKTISSSLWDPAAGSFLVDVSGRFVWRPKESVQGAIVLERVWRVTPASKSSRRIRSVMESRLREWHCE